MLDDRAEREFPEGRDIPAEPVGGGERRVQDMRRPAEDGRLIEAVDVLQDERPRPVHQRRVLEARELRDELGDEERIVSRQRGDERRAQGEVVGRGVARRAGPAVAVERLLREDPRPLELQVEDRPPGVLVGYAHQPADDDLVRRVRHPPDHDDHVELEAREPRAADVSLELSGTAGREGPHVDDLVAVGAPIECDRVAGAGCVVNEEHLVRRPRRQGRQALHLLHRDHAVRAVDHGLGGRLRLHRGQRGKGMERDRHLRRCRGRERAQRRDDRPVQDASLLHDVLPRMVTSEAVGFSPTSP